ncbi:hypothetical protein AKJ16_DCAP22125, partial [Drosera capensis]
MSSPSSLCCSAHSHQSHYSRPPAQTPVELEEQLESGEGFWDGPTEAVGVDVEEGKISEETQLGREVPGNVSMVEVYAGYDTCGWGEEGGNGAEDAGVGTDIGSDPVACEVEWVGYDGGFPCLEGNIGSPEPLHHLDFLRGRRRSIRWTWRHVAHDDEDEEALEKLERDLKIFNLLLEIFDFDK